MGSFRGGKRGGSRTAHLKGAAMCNSQPCSTRPSAAAKALPSSLSSACAAACSSDHSAAPQYSCPDESDSDAVISDSSDDDSNAQPHDAEQQLSDADQQDDEELQFEVDVVDTLGALSQGSAWDKSDLLKQVSLIPVAAASPSRSGIRQSRRLAALAAGESSSEVAPGQLPLKCRQTGSTRLADQQSDAVAAPHGSAAGKPKNSVTRTDKPSSRQQGSVASLPQLSQAVLEASAKVLRDLVGAGRFATQHADCALCSWLVTQKQKVFTRFKQAFG